MSDKNKLSLLNVDFKNVRKKYGGQSLIESMNNANMEFLKKSSKLKGLKGGK